MKFKTDENLPVEACELLNKQGHDALTVLDQKLGGAADDQLSTVCQSEKRVLVTLDFDFSDIRHYPPSEHHGIIVLKATSQSKKSIVKLLEGVLKLLNTEPVEGKLWIVEENKIRIRE